MANDKETEKMTKTKKKRGGDPEVGTSQVRLSKRNSKVPKSKHGDERGEEKIPRGSGEGKTGGSDEFQLGELPRKIIAREDIPEGGRINTYSRIDLLRDIKDILHDTPEFDWLMDSVFGKLFALPTRYCEFSGRLVHQLLCRSLVTTKKHEMWFVFGGKPIRYSLREFAMMTGLNCNPIPPKDVRKALYTPEPGSQSHWKTLFGKLEQLSINDLVRMLQNDMVEKMPSKRMSNTKKLQLCLVLLVDGVLCNKSSNICAMKKTVEMVRDVEKFCEYPWGRRSFLRSMEMVKVGKRVKDPETLAKKFCQSHMSNHGLTIAFHLLAIYTVPLLEKIVPVSKTDTYFSDPKFRGLTKYHPFHNKNVCEAEEDPGLYVDSILSSGHSADDWDLTWDDEVHDELVENILSALEAGYEFKPEDWMVHEMRRGFRLRKRNNAKIKTEFAGLGGMEDAGVLGDELLAAIEAINDYHDDRKWQAIQSIDEDRRTEIRSLFEHVFGNKGAGAGEEMDEDTKYNPRPSKSGKRKVRGESDVESLNLGKGRGDDAAETVQKPKKRKGQKRKSKQTRADKAKEVVDVDEVEDVEEVDDGGDRKLDGGDVGTKGDNMDGDQVSQTEKETGMRNDGDDDVVHLATSLFQGTPPKEHTTAESVDVAEENQPNVDNRSAMEKDISSIAKEAELTAQNINEETVGPERTDTVTVEDKIEREGDVIGDDARKDGGGKDIAEVSEKTVVLEKGASSGAEPTNVEQDEEDSAEEDGSDGNESNGSEEHSVDETVGADGREGNVERSPAKLSRSLRSRQAPKKYGQTPEEKDQPEDETEENHPMSAVSPRKKKALLKIIEGRAKKELTVLGTEVTKAFYKELYKPKYNVSNMHIEAILSMIWSRHGEQMLGSRVAIMDDFFVNCLIQEHGRYSRMKNPPVPFGWNRPIVNYVAGKVKNKSGSLRWLIDVDNLYAAMSWGGNHWVALSINLLIGTISIMDSNQNLYAEPRIGWFMKPLIEILPLVIRDLVDPTADKPETFNYYRDSGIPQYERPGDSGPITAKFIELNANGLEFKEDMTDDDVDNIRMKYAVDVYEENGEPL